MLSLRDTVHLLYKNELNPLEALVRLTWSELFDATVTGAVVDREEIFEPGDLWVRDATGSTQHGGCPRPLHHLQLGTHVYTGEAEWQQVLYKRCTEVQYVD